MTCMCGAFLSRSVSGLGEGRRATAMEQLSEIWDEHKGKIVGIVGGLAVGLFILRHGFWRTAFVGALIAVGLWLGAVVDREGWPGVAERVAHILQRRR